MISDPPKPAEFLRRPRRIDQQIRELPAPDAAAQQQSEALITVLRDQIAAAGGRITFADYMSQVLYAPGLGYYSSGQQKFGPGGDFVTAPEISPLFSRCLARQCRQVLAGMNGAYILEVGGGSGIMAAEVLAELERLHSLPQTYWILDLSADLRQRQAQTLTQRVPHLRERVQWLDRLPDAPFQGVVLANELLDAMPVHRFQIAGEGHVQELHVGWEGERFVWIQDEPSTAVLAARIRDVAGQLPGANRYVSEINLAAEAWIHTVAELLHTGLVLIVDYGFPRQEYYHAQRSAGTLMCHYRHRSHDDPFVYPGLQDITAHVDFTAMAEAGAAAGMHVAGYNTQGFFLLANGLNDMLAQLDPDDTPNYLRASQAVKTLTLPSEMGELFKVLAMTRNIDAPLQGFMLQDLRNRL